MDYKHKYLKYKNKYLQLKNTNQIGGKKCQIDETDKVTFGDGGSTSIIVITKDKKVYKIFTLYTFSPDLDLYQRIKKQNKMVNTEIKIYELLTKNIVNKNISNHIVKYVNSNNCNNAKSLFKKCPSSYIDFLKLADDKKTKMCNRLYQGHPNIKLNNKYKVIEIEYCNYSCADFINDVSKLPEIEMEKYLDIFFFQIIHTIISIQKVYPFFTHNEDRKSVV